MYLAIDIGGTKTLVASFGPDGELLEQSKFHTPDDYDQFISDLEQNVAKLSTKNFSVAAAAVPGLLDRKEGKVVALGNLDWQNKPIRDDISNILNGLPVLIENDSRCAGLAESVLLKDQYQNVLYLTVSTGIGGALLEDGQLVKELEDTELGKMPLIFDNKITHWEDFASGRAIVEYYGMQASEIDDPATWAEIGKRIAYGLGAICSVLQPEVIVFGGGAGRYADRFKKTISEYLEKELHPVVKRPKALLAAQRKDNDSIYGCFELARRHHEQSTAKT